MTSTDSARPWSSVLGPGPSVPVVLQELSQRHDGTGWHGVACLWGEWCDGQAVVTHSPLRCLLPGEDLIEVIAELPTVGAGEAQLGGGWIGTLPYVPGCGPLGFYDHLIRNDPDVGWVFETLGLPGREAAVNVELLRWKELLEAARASTSVGGLDGIDSSATQSWSVGSFTSVIPDERVREDYLAKVEEAVERIHHGDFYQLNLCTRLTASFRGDPLALFAEVAGALRPPFAGFVSDDHLAMVSLSPELFLRSRDGTVTTSPIKGTAPRRPDETDSAVLRASTKDAAENIMITDLMRNDLSRVCRPGTVVVEDLLSVVAHPGVWHLVSTVSGRLAAGVGPADLLRATFPPGSVTGAPKVAALAAIAELEPVDRGAYTGAFGMISPLAGVELNVLIRSFEVRPDRIELGVGGGITVESVPMLEWRECLHKAAPLLRSLRSDLALPPDLSGGLGAQRPESTDDSWAECQAGDGVFETLLAVDETVLRLPDHLARLDRSCRELYRLGIPPTLSTEVLRVARRPDETPGGQVNQRRAIRIVARPRSSGEVDFVVSSRPIGPRLTRSDVMPGTRPGALWRHKWADRTTLDRAETQAASASGAKPGSVLPLLMAADGTVLETTRGNIFVITDTGLMTPPLRDDLLPGVTRRATLDVARSLGLEIRLEPFDLDRLRQAQAAFWTSSLSGVVAIDRCGDQLLGQRLDLVAELNRSLGFDRGE